MDLPQAVIFRCNQTWIATSVRHQLMAEDTQQMHDPCSTHSQALKDEITDVEI
jgi:hypothetical protein